MRLLFLLLFFPLCLSAQHNNAGCSIAIKCINSLDSAQKARAVFPFDEMSRYEWHYVPATMMGRQGIALRLLDSVQKQNVYALLTNYLSDKGYEKTKKIMDNEYLLKELEPNNTNRIPENYFIAFYGDPAKDSVWGWKFSGHHCGS